MLAAGTELDSALFPKPRFVCPASKKPDKYAIWITSSKAKNIQGSTQAAFSIDEKILQDVSLSQDRLL